MRVPRKDDSINDYLEVLDEKYLAATSKSKTDLEAMPRFLESLTSDENSWIDGEIGKCIDDRRYFMENYYVIRDERGRMRTLSPFWDHQEIIWEVAQTEWDTKGCIRLIILKPRQAGSTTWEGAFIFHSTIFVPNSYSLVMAQDERVSDEIYQRLMEAYHALPPFLRPEYLSKQQGRQVIFQRSDEQLRAVDPGLGSTLHISNAQKATGVAIGRCQTPDSWVWTTDGPLTLQHIQAEYTDRWNPSAVDEVGYWFDLIRPLYSFSVDKEGRIVESRITRLFMQEYCGPIQTVYTSSGTTINKSCEHHVLCGTVWKNSLLSGDFAAYARTIPFSSKPTRTNPDEAEFMAWLIGEGWEGKNGGNAVRITQKNDEVRKRIEDVTRIVVNPTTLTNETSGRSLTCTGGLRAGEVKFCSKRWRKYIESKGYVWGKKCRTKQIPEFILNSDRESSIRFLRTYFEAEGCVNHVVEVSSLSKQIMEGLRFMLARFGIVLRISTVWKKQKNRPREQYIHYRGYIGGPSLVRFHENIGFISDRKNARLAHTAGKAKGSNSELEPVLTDMLRRACVESHVSVKYVMGSCRYVSEQNLTLNSVSSSVDRLERLCAKVSEVRRVGYSGVVAHRSTLGVSCGPGSVFGRWTVVELSGKRKSNRDKLWKCRCTCGTEQILGSNELRSGMSQSCGCLTREKSKYKLSSAFNGFVPEIAMEWVHAIREKMKSGLGFDRVDGVTVKDYDGWLMDIEVEHNHNYPTSGIMTHNTVRNFLGSEASRWPDAQVWTTDIKPSLNAPDMVGFIESTAFGRSGLYYNMWRAAEAGKSIWRALFIPVYKVRKYSLPVYKSDNFILTADERSLRRNVKAKENFTIPLGFFKWRRNEIVETINATGSDESHYESYPVTPTEAFISSGFGAFPRKCLNEQSEQHCRDPILIGEIEYNGPEQAPILKLHKPEPDELLDKPKYHNRLWVWELPNENEAIEYYGSGDISSGDGRDYTDLPFYRIGYGLEPTVMVAEWHGLINPSHAAKVVAALGYWYHTCELAIEYAAAGVTTGDELRWVLDYPNIYRWKHMDKVSGVATQHIHWLTNMRTREDMINRMGEALLDKTIIIRNRHTIEEMRDFGRFEGEIKAQGIDNNDDAAVANCINVCALHQSGKRQEFAEATGLAGEGGKHAYLLPKTPQLFAIHNQFGQAIPVQQTITSLEMGQQDYCRHGEEI